jgi:hypothetical protein
MNVAVIWAMVQREKTGAVPKLSSAYYDGSIAVVRFVLVTFALVAMLIPAALGAVIFIIALNAQDAAGVSGSEMTLIGAVALILASPSFYLIIRYVLAPFAAIRDGLRPVAALRRSRIYTLGRFWPIAGRFVLLVIYLSLLGLPFFLFSEIFNLFHWTTVSNYVFETLATLILLPIGNLFMLRVYRLLEQSFNARAATEMEGIIDAEASQAEATA